MEGEGVLMHLPPRDTRLAQAGAVRLAAVLASEAVAMAAAGDRVVMVLGPEPVRLDVWLPRGSGDARPSLAVPGRRVVQVRASQTPAGTWEYLPSQRTEPRPNLPVEGRLAALVMGPEDALALLGPSEVAMGLGAAGRDGEDGPRWRLLALRGDGWVEAALPAGVLEGAGTQRPVRLVAWEGGRRVALLVSEAGEGGVGTTAVWVGEVEATAGLVGPRDAAVVRWNARGPAAVLPATGMGEDVVVLLAEDRLVTAERVGDAVRVKMLTGRGGWAAMLAGAMLAGGGGGGAAEGLAWVEVAVVEGVGSASVPAGAEGGESGAGGGGETGGREMVVSTRWAVTALEGLWRVAVVWPEPVKAPAGAGGGGGGGGAERVRRPSEGASVAAAAARAFAVREVSLVNGEAVYQGPARREGLLSVRDFQYITLVFVGLMVVVVVFVLVSEKTLKVVLPTGVSLVGPGKRLMATILDLLPGLALAASLYGVSFFELFSASAMSKPGAAAPWFVGMLLAMAHSTLGEAIAGRSMGKMLMGYAVAGFSRRREGGGEGATGGDGRTAGAGDQRQAWEREADEKARRDGYELVGSYVLGPPRPWQALVRNVVKWGLFPLTILVLLDANMRHPGDVLSRTVTVEPSEGADGGGEG
jgi:hypothetical protein